MLLNLIDLPLEWPYGLRSEYDGTVGLCLFAGAEWIRTLGSDSGTAGRQPAVGPLRSLSRQRFNSRRHMLVKRCAREPVAVLGHCKLVGRDSVLELRSLTIRIPESHSVRQCNMAWKHRVINFNYGLRARPFGDHSDAAATRDTKFSGIDRAHPQRTCRIFGTPARISNNGVRCR